MLVEAAMVSQAVPRRKFVCCMPIKRMEMAKLAQERDTKPLYWNPMVLYSLSSSILLYITSRSLISITDGSGWIKIRTASGTGLVPASYTEPISPASPTPGPMTLTRLPSNYSASNVSLASSITASINPATASTSSLTGQKKQGPAVAPRRGAKRVKYVEAMYAYEARTASEISISAGDKVVLVQADQGDGWCEVEKGGRTGIVPASYVRDA